MTKPIVNLNEKEEKKEDKDFIIETPPPEYAEKEGACLHDCSPRTAEELHAAAQPLLATLNPPEYVEVDIESPKKPISDIDLPQIPINDIDFPQKPIPELDPIDPWEIVALPDSGNETKFAELNCSGKLHRVVVQWCGKLVALLVLLYLFICSLTFLAAAFRLVGGKTAGKAFSSSALMQNPVAGLMIGILATVLVQSSSTSTSIVVTMVASGLLNVRTAIPMIMGANIGTSVTNTVVSLAQSGDRDEFRRAFGGAVVHDMFNWLCVLVLLPIESTTGYLYYLTGAIVNSYKLTSVPGANRDFLKTITKPFTKLIIQLDTKVITAVAVGDDSYANHSMIKEFCRYESITVQKNLTSTLNVSSHDGAIYNLVNVTEKIPTQSCSFLLHGTGLSDGFVGLILLVASLVMLCLCLIMMVKVLNSVFQGRMAGIIKKTINANFPGKLSFLTGYVVMLVGMGMTILVQSSSVFTSAMTPLVGIGVVKLERMYPLTLGSNIGTTFTGVLAAMAASGDNLEAALQISFCHLFFNISGILLFYPVPATRLPISMAKKMGDVTSRYRWFAVLYMVVMFLGLPAAVFALSMWGVVPLMVVVGMVALVCAFAIVVNLMQEKCRERLPKLLQDWEFLPECLHSFEPMDRIIRKVLYTFRNACPSRCCCCCKPVKPDQRMDADAEEPLNSVAVGTPIYRSPIQVSSANSSPSETPFASRNSSMALLNSCRSSKV